MEAVKIRKTYLDFFKSKKHVIKPSDALIPSSDPSLLFTTAGMVQFKALYSGAPLDFSRATTVQKCLRAGGKGSDLENVGKTLRHHTFFEMLGNFSFGDYFKEEAIAWAWEFLIDVLKMPKEKIYISVYKDDDEAYDIWTKKMGIPADHMVRLGKKDNFWGPAGTTGACGPSSEIYYDLGKEKSCGSPDCAVGCDCERFIEFWNLVFPQFNQEEDGKLLPLERKGIDTGMGLERLALLLQGVSNNYETDLFAPIIKDIGSHTSEPYEKDNKYAYHVIADHIRALTFALSENILPANEGRGYVMRRILRRAVRYGRKLDIMEAFLYKLVPVVVSIMKEAYPELEKSREHVSSIIKSEEERFHLTLDSGMSLLDEILIKSEKKKVLVGEDVFKLYDTYGIPIDIIRDIARDEEYTVDELGFEKLMVSQRERARSNWKGAKQADELVLYQEIRNKYGRTEFVGYDKTSCETEISTIIKEGKVIETAQVGDEVEVIVKKTPFYAESGGQVGDIGEMTTDAMRTEVMDTRKVGDDVYIHLSKVLKGTVKAGETVHICVDESKRNATARNHTATHILHNVLRRVLGNHVKQAGSLVEPERLRFDFTHVKALTKREIERIEELVNEEIMVNHKVTIHSESLEDVKKMDVIALFNEKYGEKVRVVNIGEVSKELCGGMHVIRTGDIGIFKIVVETSVAAGIRRIEAYCGKEALAYIKNNETVIDDLSQLLKSPADDLLSRVQKLQEENKALLKEKEQLNKKEIAGKFDDMLSQAVDVKGVSVLGAEIDNTSMDMLRDIVDALKLKLKSGVIVLGSTCEGKVSMVCSVTQDLVKKGLSASDIVKKVAKVVGGGGGGRKDMASAGGKDPSKLKEALLSAQKVVEELLK
ncbi:MAG: alanine--tRNA ligase [Candidatus Ancaeobacter aquaticus]|nr:alanine--tRNA ligase [Candidatus Ancaeobacter aquaticus]